MNKTQLIEYIAEHASLSKVTASRALEAAMDAVCSTLREGPGKALKDSLNK